MFLDFLVCVLCFLFWESVLKICRGLGEALGFSDSLGLEIQASLGFVAFTSWLNALSSLVIFFSDKLGLLRL
jgi:hypothetical protein